MIKTHSHCRLKVFLLLGVLAYLGIAVFDTVQQLTNEDSMCIIVDVEEQNETKESEESLSDTELEEKVVYQEMDVTFNSITRLKTAPTNDKKHLIFSVDFLELGTPPPEQVV